MDNQDILFASLVGSKVLETVPGLNQIQNYLQKHVLPPIPFLPFRRHESVDKIQEDYSNTNWLADDYKDAEEQFFPLSLSIDDGETYFLLPYEPILSISGKNNIVRRNVAKWNSQTREMFTGTIKERWSQDDYEITITGVLIGAFERGDMVDCFPKNDFEKLKNLLIHAKEIRIQCAPLELLGISKIVVTDFTFPFTKGENVQAYEIKAFSDFSYNLLIEV